MNRIRPLLTSLLRIVLFSWLGFAAVIYAFQASLVFYPNKELFTTPAAVDLHYQDVELTTSDEVSIHGWYLPHPNTRGTVLFLHGNAGNISHRLETLEMFHQLGLSVFIIDYRGYGRSEGEPSEQGTYRDAEAAWRWLVDDQGVDPMRIVVFGRSLGGGVATWLAHRLRDEHGPGGLVLESTFTSIPDMGADIYPLLPVRWLARIHYDNLDRIAEIDAPLWLAHSPQDEVVPFEHGEKLFEAAGEPKAFFELRGGHNNGFLLAGQGYLQALDGFLTQILGSGREDGGS